MPTGSWEAGSIRGGRVRANRKLGRTVILTVGEEPGGVPD